MSGTRLPPRRRLLWLGGALLGAGAAVLVGVAGWVLVSDWWADRAAADGVAGLERSWKPGPGGPLAASGGGTPVAAGSGAARSPAGIAATPPLDSAFAVLRVPRLGADWARPVIEGTAPGDLRRGVGHYPGTALPGAAGNFAVAGHRTTWGQPFADIDLLAAGDEIVVETAGGWFTYRVTGHEVVRPDHVAALAAGPDRTITLTACHPRWSARWRWVVHGILVGSRARGSGVASAGHSGRAWKARA